MTSLLCTLFIPVVRCWAIRTNPPEPFAEEVPGSGYKDMEGIVVDYVYGGFSAFRFIVEGRKIRWTGMNRYFEGITRAVDPIISKVDEKVYFSSWPTIGNGGDNVVHNFDLMEVNAHLNPDQSEPKVLEMLHGVIDCWNTPDCLPPDKRLTSDKDLFKQMGRNQERQHLPPLFGLHNNAARSSADRAARAELAGLAIEYAGTKIEVKGNETIVIVDEGEPETFPTFATKVGEGIFFISWLGDHGGHHIVVNRRTMKAFKHISALGKREEIVYDVICFDTSHACVRRHIKWWW